MRLDLGLACGLEGKNDEGNGRKARIEKKEKGNRKSSHRHLPLQFHTILIPVETRRSLRLFRGALHTRLGLVTETTVSEG